MKLVTADEMKEIERRAEADEKFPVMTRQLMLNAGQSVFEAIISQERFAENEEGSSELDDAQVVVLAGPGNNGGDAMVTTSLLRQRFPQADIQVYFYRRPRPEDDDGFPESLTYTEAEEQEGIALDGEPAFEELESDLENAALVVDGLLGAGVKRQVTGALARTIDLVNEAREERQYDANPLFVVSIDVPSGIHSDTGEPLGTAIEADLTVTLGYPKRGLYNYASVEHTGRVLIGDIGIPATLATQIEMEVQQNRDLCLITAGWVRRNLPRRPLTGHKGTFGKLMILSGAATYLGAPYLCTAASMRSGAGLVTLAAPAGVISAVSAKLSENTFLPLPEIDNDTIAREVAANLAKQIVEGKYRALLLGPGLGHSKPKTTLVEQILEWQDFPKMVIDADGLNLLADIPAWWRNLPPGNILTPHPGELATLRNHSITQIESDRVQSAQTAARLFNQVIVLKGAYTVVAAPDGRVKINPTGNPALATAGSGDVLAGLAAGILTQRAKDADVDTFDVACVAVYLHALAGELARRDLGDMGTLAGDLLPLIPYAVTALKEGDKLE
jgi:ADP-dependent NAD(P)H-hydrate dehydratase / NAD(P)H-hydrate epimerase